MVTQVELELSMYGFGKFRAKRTIENNEDGGRAQNNPYAQELYRRFAFPLAEEIQADMDEKLAGRAHAHIVLLKGMDPEAVAFLAMRTILSCCIGGLDDGGAVRKLDHLIGRCILHEQMLTVFEHMAPALFHTLVNDFDRKLSKNERHRMTVAKMQAKANGIELPDWGIGSVQQVGQYLINKCSQIGLLTVERNTDYSPLRKRRITEDVVLLSAEVRDIIEQITDHVVELGRYALPCIEQPLDWSSVTEGGFHTPEMKRIYPYCVQTAPTARQYLQENTPHEVLSAINHLQQVKWRVNPPLLAAVQKVSKHFDMDEIMAFADFPRPDRPEWLKDQKKEDMTADQLVDFAEWRRAMSTWHTDMKLRGTRWGRFTTAMRVAMQFVEYPAIHFVYFADFRSRLYCRTTGISPQGSDLQKSLLEFSEGKCLSTENAVCWFKVAGANRYGWDKKELAERVRLVDEHKEFFLQMAEDPIAHRGWTEADVPLQFLAWLLEYKAWNDNPTTFESRIAVGMDGSCNGLQNFSAMLRDEVGGKATNLVPSNKPNDIYSSVAMETTTILNSMEDDEQNYRQQWLKHGINRTLVKRSVMTLPYGSTRFSCAEFIVQDYLKHGKAVEFPKESYQAAAQYLSHPVWKGIGVVVVKAREAMDWLQASAKLLVKEGAEEIMWITPTGFPVLQHYWKANEHRIRTRLHGNCKIIVYSESDEADRNAHKNGIAPNFVHSMDASHLHKVTNAAAKAGVTSLAMIHDDYGTHAADAQTLYTVIRDEFVAMYTAHDPLADFKARYPMIDEPPAKGNLDLELVKQSVYFFL